MATDITSGEIKISISANSSKVIGKAAANGRVKTGKNFKDNIKLTSEVDMECTDGPMAMSTKESLGMIIDMELAR